MKADGRRTLKKADFSSVRYIISDWDGTVVNSNQEYAASFVETISAKFNIDKESLRYYYLSTFGRSLSQQIREALGKFAKVKIEDTRELEGIFFKHLTGIIPEILPGAKEFLTALKRKGLKIVIWSGTRTDVLGEKISLLSFSSMIDFYIGNVPGDKDLVKGPGLFGKIAERFGISFSELVSQSLIIGDGISDMEAGIAVGAKVAAFRLKDTRADFVFDNYNQLLDRL